MKTKNKNFWYDETRDSRRVDILSISKNGRLTIRESMFCTEGKYTGNDCRDIYLYAKNKYDTNVYIINDREDIVYSECYEKLNNIFNQGGLELNGKNYNLNDFSVMSIKNSDNPDEKVEVFSTVKDEYLKRIIMNVEKEQVTFLRSVRLMPVTETDKNLRWVKITFSNNYSLHVAVYFL